MNMLVRIVQRGLQFFLAHFNEKMHYYVRYVSVVKTTAREFFLINSSVIKMNFRALE